MTTSQIIACATAWTAAITAVLGAVLSLRAREQARNILTAIRAERRTFTAPGGGEITVTAPMSDADYETFKARWLETYGKPGTAHPAIDGEVCGAYRVPSSAEDSGLCARCGMYDYKHQE